MATIEQIMRMPPEKRRSIYTAVDIGNVIIDGNKFENYGTYSFIWEKSFVNSPKRSNGGVIENLNSYTTFVTGHFKINFTLISIDDYRRLMDLLYAKSEHTVTCYDIVKDRRITLNMYFTPEEMPKLFTITERLQSMDSEEWESYVELLGVQDLTVEMVSTNSKTDTQTVTYHLNPPNGKDRTVTLENIARGNEIELGKTAGMQGNTFGNTYRFAKWNTKADKSGTNFIDGEIYTIFFDMDMYAVWERLG